MHPARRIGGAPRRALTAALALLATALAWALPANAWDTKEAGLGGDDKGKWVALYACLGNTPRFNVDCSHNEHERLADMVLARLIGGDSEWYIGGSTDLKVVDLNASLYRPELRRRGTYPSGAGGGRPLEERVLADPPHWAGIPDFSYSIYDWINKNHYCPPLPLNRQDDPKCHIYGVYHGAIFNASHWATQDELGYRRLHAVAVDQARKAAALRRSIQAAGPVELEAYRDVIREAELMAMAYEGYAQHFLQDRWAMGHMWNRWGAPDHVGYPYWNRQSQGALVGAMVGIIHGAEAVIGVPDALSSPAPGYSAAGGFSAGAGPFVTGMSAFSINEMEWAFPGGQPSGGLGDYRLEDLQDEHFGADLLAFRYKDWPLNVRRQRGWLISCSAGGWREVIVAMGRNGGGYGLQEHRLTGLGAGGLPEQCFRPLATNRSMRDGWGFEAQTEGAMVPWDHIIADAARVAMMTVKVGDSRPENLSEAILDRPSLIRITNALALYGRFNPDGTELAAGQLPDWGEAKTSNQYPLARYFEPADLDTLPESSPDGRDKQALYGFFNRAHAGHFCRKARDKELFEDLRGRPEPERRAACRYLADRLFLSTPPDYQGPQLEERRLNGKDGQKVTPLCALQPDDAERVALSAYDEETPYYVHQGYVAYDAVNRQSKAYGADPLGYSNATLGAWCDLRPVLGPMADEALANADVVGKIEDARGQVTLKGRNLGKREGELRIGRNWGDSVAVEDIRGWSDDEIVFVMGEQLDRTPFDDDEAFVFVRRHVPRGGDRDFVLSTASSVGRFVVRKELPRPLITGVKVRADGRLVYSDKPLAPSITDQPLGEDTPPPPPPPPPKTGAFLPIGPAADVWVEIVFDRDMERDAEGTAFRLGDHVLEGRWVGERIWQGKVKLPEVAEYQARWRGYRNLAVAAKAQRGEWFDADPEANGTQQATQHDLLFDTRPLHVERVRVRAGGREIYDARWSRGPDFEAAHNWVAGIIEAIDRRLSLNRSVRPPAGGQGLIRVELSEAPPASPIVRVGGAVAIMKGKDRVWTGTFDFAQARTVMDGPDIPIEISVGDVFSRNFDADPRTPTLITPRRAMGYGAGWWAPYEAAFGGASTEVGGPDKRHKLGDPPDLSLVIILDKSGSMDEGGRMASAKDGIARTFAQLPKDRRIEMAAVAFDGCGDPQVMAFTRDLDKVREFLLAAQPGGSTAVARAHEVAAALLAGSANPASKEWRYATFTDGVETCGGDAAASMRKLQEVIAGHRSQLAEARPEPEPKKEEVAAAQCFPQAWRTYEAKVQDVRVLPTIRLVEHRYEERALADGRCLARLTSSEYGVFYGSSGARRKWGVNSRPSREKVEFASSQNGEAGIERVRNLARQRQRAGSLAEARKQIADAVGEALNQLAMAPPLILAARYAQRLWPDAEGRA